MQICKDGCGTHNPDTASVCLHCQRSLRSALRLYNPGDQVRHYRVGKIIGWGGFGAVYKAEDTRQPGSRFALKESLDPSGMTSFQGEFAVLQQHPHAHLPRYEEMFVEQGNGYLVMEFIPGQSLEEVSAAAGGPLEEEQVLGFALQLCKVLDYLHRQNPPILHRDLKPANVRLTPSGLIKLVDFGLFKQGTDKVISSRLGLTPAYAPMEQHPLNPGHTDQRSDIYGLGATLYQLLTGELPETSFERIKTPRDPLVPPERLNPRLSHHVAAAITKALNLAMQDRYQDIASFRLALLGQSPVQPAAAAPARRSPARVATPTMPTWVPEMVNVPAGPFLMGSSDTDKQADSDEKLQHRLTLPDFWIAKTPVTNAQFRPFVEGDGYRNRTYWTAAGWQWREQEKIVRPNYWYNEEWNRADYPVAGINWFEAVAYCRWLTAQTGHEFRLPSEAEWEKAARGTDGRIYPWGNTWKKERCNSEEAGINDITPVVQYPSGASPYGALDMAGNVWEWCATKATKYEKSCYPYQTEDEWSEAYLEADSVRRIRGGSFGCEQKFVRGAYRRIHVACYRDDVQGLRVASRMPVVVPPMARDPQPPEVMPPTVRGHYYAGYMDSVRRGIQPPEVILPTVRLPQSSPNLPAWVPKMVKVPTGPFLMGSSNSDKQAYSDEKPQHTLILPDYWIAKTPVTNAQFRPFVEGDGYRNRTYWTAAGWQWRENEKVVKPGYWDDRLLTWDYNPVVGVSWFEAMAYCRWLTAQTGHKFRLPSEAEWEKAARGTDGRIYPWGTAWEIGRCNFEEAGVKSTTPVGKYWNGGSPYGAQDMAGNVYEWCATKYGRSYPYQVEDEWTEAYLEADPGRMLRGGSWYSEQKYVRGAARNGIGYARYRNYDVGLRVASRSPLPGSSS